MSYKNTHIELPEMGEESKEKFERNELFDAALFVWRLRYFILIGFAVGAVVGGVYAFLKMPTVYTSEIKIKLVSNSTIEQDKISSDIENLAIALNSPSIVAEAYDKMFEQNAEFAKVLKDSSISKNEFMSDTLQNLNIKSFFSLKPIRRSNDVLVVVQWPFKGFGSKIAEVSQSYINYLIVAYNEALTRMVDKKKFRLKPWFDVLENEYYATFYKMKRTYYDNVRSIKLKLYDMEIALEAKLRKASVKMGSTLPGDYMAPDVNSDLHRRNLPFDSSKLLWLAQLAFKSNVIGRDEYQKILEEHDSIVKDYLGVDEKMITAEAGADLYWQEYKAITIEELIQKSPRKMFLDRVELSDANVGNHYFLAKIEEPSSKRFPFVVAAALVGVVFGFFVGALWRFGVILKRYSVMKFSKRSP